MKREILVKMLGGKGKINLNKNREIFIDKSVSKLLGCWVINLSFEPQIEQKRVYIKGSYDIQLWYASNDNKTSEVHVETVSFFECANMTFTSINPLDDEIFPKIYVTKYPTCTKMELSDEKNINLIIEGVLRLDIFKNAIILVDAIEGDEEISLNEEIDMSVNPNYIERK